VFNGSYLSGAVARHDCNEEQAELMSPPNSLIHRAFSGVALYVRQQANYFFTISLLIFLYLLLELL
jgi:hypothetical protein